VENKVNGKRLREWDEREEKKKKKEKEKYYIYRVLGLFILDYINWVGLSRFEKSQLALDSWYLFIIFFDLLSFIISTLSNLTG
jgi:hypothetical protein